jgi:hypothetical protein
MSKPSRDVECAESDAANAPDHGHISDAVRAHLAKLAPEQRAEILRMADSK